MHNVRRGSLHGFLIASTSTPHRLGAILSHGQPQRAPACLVSVASDAPARAHVDQVVSADNNWSGNLSIDMV